MQLLCQFEPQSVLKFLESHENYRLEHCLKLCQEYGITDAAIFLLERVGDVASALALVLTDVDIHIRAMEGSLLVFSTPEAEASGKGSRLLMEFPEVYPLHLTAETSAFSALLRAPLWSFSSSSNYLTS